jgi:homoserine dehydrogenase
MADALKVGVAGLGTVGASVVRLLATHGEKIGRKSGRSVTSHCGQRPDKTRDRGFDVSSGLRLVRPIR